MTVVERLWAAGVPVAPPVWRKGDRVTITVEGVTAHGTVHSQTRGLMTMVELDGTHQLVGLPADSPYLSKEEI